MSNFFFFWQIIPRVGPRLTGADNSSVFLVDFLIQLSVGSHEALHPSGTARPNDEVYNRRYSGQLAADKPQISSSIILVFPPVSSPGWGQDKPTLSHQSTIMENASPALCGYQPRPENGPPCVKNNPDPQPRPAPPRTPSSPHRAIL